LLASCKAFTMNYPRNCGCKGVRTCLKCEKDLGIERQDFFKEFQNLQPFIFCPERQKLFEGWSLPGSGPGIDFPGIYVQLNFLSPQECKDVMTNLDSMPWDISQSGRRKQNFGPKTNFKKRKLRLGTFNGFPKFSEFIQQRLREVPLLKDYQTIEQCSLEYDPSNGASIEPHIDDCWVWGERVVTVNCLEDSVLTLTRFQGTKKYNLNCVDSYKDRLIPTNSSNLPVNSVVRVPMPQGSLIVMYGEPRYAWEHCVLREDIQKRRVCIAYREFTPNYLKTGEDYQDSCEVFEKAKHFWNV